MKHWYGKKVKLCGCSKRNKMCRVFAALRLHFGVWVGRVALGMNLKVTLRGLHKEERGKHFI
jgi:hypothetical protein